MDKTVMIVDDQEVILNALDTYLQINGYQVFLQQDPTKVIDQIKENKPDIILMDISMPEMDGLTLLRKIREEELDVEVIMMTAFTSIERTVKCRELGAIDYIIKPFSDMDEILYVIDSSTARLKRWEKAMEHSEEMPDAYA